MAVDGVLALTIRETREKPEKTEVLNVRKDARDKAAPISTTRALTLKERSVDLSEMPLLLRCIVEAGARLSTAPA